MAKEDKAGQLEMVSHIRGFLVERGLNIASRSVQVKGEENWLVFKRGRRSIGVDRESGVWKKDSAEADWQCIEKPCTVTGAIMHALQTHKLCKGRRVRRPSTKIRGASREC